MSIVNVGEQSPREQQFQFLVRKGDGSGDIPARGQIAQADRPVSAQKLAGRLNGDVVRTKEFTWTLGTNFSMYKNEIVRIDDTLDENGKPASQVQ